jgi:hypothetical protein
LAALNITSVENAASALTVLLKACFRPICFEVAPGEIGRFLEWKQAGAEGATAPETLRQTDRATR